MTKKYSVRDYLILNRYILVAQVEYNKLEKFLEKKQGETSKKEELKELENKVREITIHFNSVNNLYNKERVNSMNIGDIYYGLGTFQQKFSNKNETELYGKFNLLGNKLDKLRKGETEDFNYETEFNESKKFIGEVSEILLETEEWLKNKEEKLLVISTKDIDEILMKRNFLQERKVSYELNDWKKHGNPFLDFTKEITQEWINKDFDKKKCAEWLNIGLQAKDSDFARWLRDKAKLTPEKVLNNGNERDLRRNYSEYLKSSNKDVKLDTIDEIRKQLEREKEEIKKLKKQNEQQKKKNQLLTEELHKYIGDQDLVNQVLQEVNQQFAYWKK